MARKKPFVVKAATDIYKAVKKDKARQARESARKERELQRLQKAAALQRQRREAEAHKLRIQQASLEDQYAILSTPTSFAQIIVAGAA